MKALEINKKSNGDDHAIYVSTLENLLIVF
jgi:hypothetical protein